MKLTEEVRQWEIFISSNEGLYCPLAYSTLSLGLQDTGNMYFFNKLQQKKLLLIVYELIVLNIK